MIRRALERPVSTLLAAAAVVVLGVFSLLRLPVSLLPALERPSLTVTVAAPSASREELLERFTRPLERQLAAIPGVTGVQSSTADGAARLSVESEWQTDPDRLRIEAERRLSGIDAEGATDFRVTVEMAAGDPVPIVEVAVFGGGSGAARTAFTREVLAPELARLPGAGEVETLGLSPLHPVVRPRAAALAARGLTAADVKRRLAELGTARAAGRAKTGAAVRPLLVREDAASLDALSALRLHGPAGESVLGDVAAVGLEEIRDESAFRLNGREGTLVRLFRAPEANAVALAARAREAAGRLGRPGRQSGGFTVQVVADRSAEVAAAARELAVAVLLGLALGVAAIGLFLGRFRPTLALVVSVPAALLSTFSAFHLAGLPLDLVSLAGLALASGMLVDSSIVVLEAIESARARGEASPELAGTRQIALPVIAGFATTVVVFLPLLYLEGLARAFFGAQAFAIAASSAAALLFSLTVSPVLALDKKSQGLAGRNPGREACLRLLDGALARPGVALAAGIAATAVALAGGLLLPRELLPAGESRDLLVRYRLAPDLAPEAARAAGAAVEARAVAALGGVPAERLATQLSAARVAEGEGEESGWIELRFADAGEAARAQPRLARELARLPGVETWVEPRPGALAAGLTRAEGRFELVAKAATPERATALAGRAAERLGGGRLSGRRDAAEAVFLSWDPARRGASGLEELEGQLRAGLMQQEAGRAYIAGAEPEIVVFATAPEEPALVPLSPSAGAGALPAAALARFTPGPRPPTLEREDGLPAMRLVLDRTAGAGGGLAERLSGVARAADERLVEGGAGFELKRSFGQLRLALGLSLLLVFLTVAATYESFALPLVVMSTVPVAWGGALGLLAITGQTLNVLSFLGLILLAGIVVNNAIVLVHRVEDHRKGGMEVHAALRLAAHERYRPILMTTLTTVAGMLPLALLPGEGVELRRSLALAVLGGMTLSTFASLLLVPVLYRLTPEGRRRR